MPRDRRRRQAVYLLAAVKRWLCRQLQDEADNEWEQLTDLVWCSADKVIPLLNVKQAAVIRHINAILLSSHASTSVCAAHLSPGNSIPYTPDTAAESFRLRRRWKCKDRKIISFPAMSFRHPNGCRSERKAVLSRLMLLGYSNCLRILRAAAKDSFIFNHINHTIPRKAGLRETPR